MNAIRLSLAAALALTLAACGGAKLGGGKEGAAEALFQASGPAASTKGKGAALRAMQSGAITGEVKVSGQKSGTATLVFDITDTDTSGAVSWNVRYDNYSDDGKNFYSGQMDMKIKFDFALTQTTASGSMVLTMKGKINISGEISDFLDADIVQTVDFSALSNTTGAGSVTVKLNGSISTSTEAHVYNNETVTFTADGELPAAEASKS